MPDVRTPTAIEPALRPGAASDAARRAILERVRAAVSRTPPDVPLAYRRSGETSRSALLRLLSERIVEYRGEVHRATESSIAQVVDDCCAAHGLRRLVAPAEL